jgi:NADH-quinone oxidoreductase subunit H
MLVRWTVPRMRYDQVMSLGYRLLIPFGLANLVATAALLALMR